MISKLSLITILLAPAIFAQTYTVAPFAGGGLPALPAQASSVPIGFALAVASDPSGNIYVANTNLSVLYKISSSGSMTLIAGTGKPGFSGDGGPASSAQLNSPNGLSVDAAGNIYIADTGNFRIRKINTSGIITTLAGNGSQGYSGDGGPATLAAFNAPYGVAIDANGNLFIADTNNQVIRKVSSSGVITTFAGTGAPGSAGDGGPAINAALAYPFNVAVDTAGNVFIADFANYAVRKVSPSGIITTFAGNHQGGNSGDGGPATSASMQPTSVAIGPSGTVYITDTVNGVIRSVSSAGIISTVAGTGVSGYSGDGGAATSAQLAQPTSVALGTGGAFYIADTNNFRIRKVSGSGIITSFAGNGSMNYSGDHGPASQATLAKPGGVAVANGIVYIADSADNRIRAVSPSGIITTLAGDGTAGYAGDNGAATSARLSNPEAVAVDASDNVFIADTYNSVVRKISPGGIITTFAGIAYGGSGGDGGPATSAYLAQPRGIAVDASGNVYIADTSNSAIRKVSLDGIISRLAGNYTPGYSGDHGPAVNALLNSPAGVAVDGSGNIYIADTGNAVIRKISTSGIITTIAGTGVRGYSGDNGPATSAELFSPSGIALDGDGNIYVSDPSNSNIRKIANGVITTIAGSGDGLSAPQGIAVANNAALYVADAGNNAVRMLNGCIQSLPSSANADAAAQTLHVPLTAAGSCAWTASDLPTWITNASSGTGTGTLALTLQVNNSGADRSATIQVEGRALTVTQAFTTAQFQDVLPGDNFFDAVNLLKSKSITGGCSPTNYCPAAVVTRAQMAVFLVRAILGTDQFTYSPTPHFTDVQPGDFGFAWIQKFSEMGITSGCGPSLYCPTASITRAQMAVFIIRARYGAKAVVDFSATPYFTDVAASDFAFNYIQRMKADNITSGCSASAYCPGSPVTRGSMAVFIMRGAFNQLLPPTQPVVTSVAPATLTNGTSATLTVTGLNTHFVAGSTVVHAVPGLVVNSVSVVDSTTLHVNVTATATANPQPLSIWITDPSGQAVLPNGLAVQ